MTEAEVNYVVRWTIPIAGGFLLLFCGFAVDFFVRRRERRQPR